ncbi:MAG: divergent polysaccharide deacetylase family protein [Rhodospirillales bacterium]|nr:divergent polysaccharide deacetylase family protein [Rhodospirillales bacterium]
MVRAAATIVSTLVAGVAVGWLLGGAAKPPEPATPPVVATAPALAPAITAVPTTLAPGPVEPRAPAVARPLWDINAVPPPAANGRPMIAVVIDDMGIDRKRSARTAALPGPLTLAYLPYGHDIREQTQAARAAGHELLLHVPMQPGGAEDPGPNALTVGLSPAEIRRRIAAGFAAVPNAVGLNNHMGSKFTADPGAMAPVIAEIKARSLLFLDSRTTPKTVAAEFAAQAGVPTVSRDVFLDNEREAPAVRARLAELEAIARKRGYAIAIGHPHDATLAELEPWLRGLGSRGFALVPVSAIIRYRLAVAEARGQEVPTLATTPLRFPVQERRN